jgi:NTE family protein
MSAALVLAGGGVTGIAWETGVLYGLQQQGNDILNEVDVVIGTSAGATVGAQVLSGVPLDELFGRQISDAHGEISPNIDLELLAKVFGELGPGGTETNEQRQRIGDLALHAPTISEDERRRVIEWRLPQHEWPDKKLLLTAINAVTGEFVTWDKQSGITLVDAVASSCAVPSVWPCVTINHTKFYDGGLRTSTNAQLAAGYNTVYVIAPLTQGITPLIAMEIAALRDAGSTVHVVVTDSEAIQAMGPNSLDPRFRRIAAEHGKRQGETAFR